VGSRWHRFPGIGHRTYVALIEEFRQENPATYEEGIGYFQPNLIEDAVEAGAFDRLPALLVPLARASERYVDTYEGVLTFLLFHGQLRPVLESMRAAWPTIRDSAEILQWAKDEFGRRLLLLTLLDYVESNPAPRFDAPELQDALTVVEEADLLTSRRLFQSIAGEEGEPRRAAGFVPILPPRAAEREEAIEQTLLPDRQALPRHLEAMQGFFDIYGPYRIAPLLKTVPDYLAFLEEHGLASGRQLHAARHVVEAIQQEYLDTLRAGGWKVAAYLEQE
jgi:hypothetical protein